MVWPRRKIQLVASSAAPGIEGVRAVLKEFKFNFFESEPSTEDITKGFTESWWELCAYEELSPATELVFWPEVIEHNYWREKALAQGLPQQSIQSLIHNILEDELILRITEPTVLIEGRPLLGHVLNEAGFEPSLLWPTADGQWQCERKQGLYWLLPESWLDRLMEESPLGRDPEMAEVEKATWVVRETRVDFYRVLENVKFVGHLPRWPEPLEEQMACQNIGKCLELGVSWLEIRLALTSIWSDKIMTDNSRWKIDDFGWNAGAGGEKLPAEHLDHVEDRWARRDRLLAQNCGRHGYSVATCAESENSNLVDWAGFKSSVTR